MENNVVIGVPFVSHVDQEARPTIENAKEFAKKQVLSTSSDVLYSGIYKLMGYRYDLRPFLKLFLYKQYGSWSEGYAPNKTTLRKSVYGRIDRIVEIEKE